MARLLPVLLVALALPVRAEERWHVAGNVLALSAPVLPGIVLGGAAEVSRSIAGPFHLSARLGAGTTSDSNETWLVQQTLLLALAGVGVSRIAGVARLAADLEGGALGVLETARRHQFERLTAAQIPDRERTASTVAPFVALRFSVALELLGGWRLRLEAGPDVAWIRMNGEVRTRAGVVSGIGASRGF